MNKLLIPILAVLAIAGSVFGIMQMSSADETQRKLDALNEKVAANEKALRDALAGLAKANDELISLRARNAALMQERDDAKKKAQQIAAAGGEAAEAGSTAKNSGQKQQFDVRGMMQGFAKQMDKPETRKAMTQMSERMVSGAYAPLYKKLGISEQDSKLISELLAERNFTALDKGRKLLDGKSTDDASMAAVRSEVQATKAEYDAKLKGVLGEQSFNELTAYEQTVGDRHALDFFDRNFQQKDQPLQQQQRDSLLNVMSEERLKNPSSEIPDLGGGPGMAMLMTDAEATAQQQKEEAYQARVLSRAPQAGLTPDQVNILQDSFKQRNEMRNMGRVMSRAFIGGGK